MAFLDPILSPLLSINPIYAIAIISLILSLITIIANKYLTNQEMMRKHKAEMKDIQKKAKELSSTDPKKAMSMQKQMMDMNMLIMKESFKPMFLTLIPFLLVFAWLNANFSYIPLDANEPFTITAELKEIGFATINVIPENKVTYITNNTQEIKDNKVSWNISAQEGDYTIRYSFDGDSVNQDLIVGNSYAQPIKTHSNSAFKKTIIGNNPLKVTILGISMKWIWAYLIFSLMFSVIFRKLFNVV